MTKNSWSDVSLMYDRSICQHIDRQQPACSKCTETCPENALYSLGEDICINPEACSMCGDCVSICPSGAIGLAPEELQPVSARMGNLSGVVLVICTDAMRQKIWPKLRSGNPVFPVGFPFGVALISVPGIHWISEADLMEILDSNRRDIVLVVPEQDAPSRPLSQAVRVINRVAMTVHGRPLIHVFSEPGILEREIERIASLSWPNIPDQAIQPELRTKRHRFGSIMLKWLESNPVPDSVTIDHPVYAEVVCDSSLCVLCGICVNQCKAGALAMSEGSSHLLHIGIACMNCGACVQICPHRALSLRQGFNFKPSFFSPQILAGGAPD